MLISAYLMFVYICIFASGCTADKIGKSADSSEVKDYKLLKDYETKKLPEKYTPELACKNGDVVASSKIGTINTEKFIKFIDNVNKGNKDRIRITSFTIEGGAIIQDIIYNGENIVLIQDTTRDGFGPREVRQYKVSKIQHEGNYYYAVVNSEKLSLLSM